MRYNVSKSIVKKIGKEGGINRVSPKAIDLVQEEATKYVLKLLAWGQTYAGHAGRRTVRKEDIIMALEDH